MQTRLQGLTLNHSRYSRYTAFFAQQGTRLAAYHTAKDASKVILVELALQENNCKQRCKQHLCPSHHLVNGGCD